MRLAFETGSKVNLLLRVGPPGVDGFHPVVTVLACLDLGDSLEFEVGSGPTLEVVGAELGDPEENLVLRVLREAPMALGAGKFRARARLVKRVPHQAGLGGGSGDAAATLEAIWQASGRPCARARLLEVAGRFGADVPVFLLGGYAVGRDRGQVLTPMESCARLPLLIVKPPAGSPTAAAYRALDAARPGHLALGEAQEAEVAALVAALGDPGAGPEAVAPLLDNDFHGVVLEACPGTARAARALEEAGALRALLAGSGSAAFGLFSGVDSRDRARAQVQAAFPEATVLAAMAGGPGLRPIPRQEDPPRA